MAVGRFKKEAHCGRVESISMRPPMIPTMAMASIAPFLPHFLLMKGAAMQPSMILQEHRVSSAERAGGFVPGCTTHPAVPRPVPLLVSAAESDLMIEPSAAIVSMEP